ncbi:hypothetical protein ANANG_G00184170 [Anguilla anguilla]|uniref:Ig-like domain-containing protein n=1 Tax=Anguilla anguilla TaxID=7936 RepID=A0A9D3RU36_ANGAN|nr:hypothetical protein ANANG_G00184170 [Anguilla anguilla]
MTDIATIYKLSLIAFACAMQAYGATCPVLECWFVQEKSGRGGGFPAAMSQEKSLLYVGTDPDNTGTGTTKNPPADIDSARIYYVTDPGASLCSSSLRPPEGSVRKPQCEINPFLPQPAMVQWAAPLTESAHSPIYLQADWLSVSAQGLDGQLALSSVMRATTKTNKPSVIVSVYSRTVSVRARLGAPVVLDCGFWTEPSSPLSAVGFSVEWRYQFRGEGRLVLAYDGKNDRLAQTAEEGAELDIAALHQTGNASLILQEAQVRHSGTYICSVYLPYLLSQVSVNLEIEEPPSLSISPRPPGAGRVSGHKQAWDGTFTQSSWLEVGRGGEDLAGGGEVVCVGLHSGGARRARVPLSVIGARGPTVEDSIAMVAVALGLYGLIRIATWTLGMSGFAGRDPEAKKEK